MSATAYRDTATWAEIGRQPAVWRDWGRWLTREMPGLRRWIENADVDEIWLSGAGTSAFIGDLVAAGVDGRGGPRVRSVPSTDLVSQPRRLVGRRPLVISFGRSGSSAESLGVMDALDALAPSAPRLNVTCNAASPLAERTGPAGRAIVLPETTHDSGFAMTSSFTTMVLTALALLDPEPGDVAARLGELADRAEALIPHLAQRAEAAAMPSRIVFLGSGALQFAAREAALKVMELAGGEIAAIWDSALGFRHGPKSFVLEGTDLVLFRSSDAYAARYDDDLAAELGDQFPGARRVVVGPGGDIDTGPLADAWAAPLHVLWAQVTGTVWSARLGHDPDDPFRGRGTLTRVVSGVTLHDPREA